MFISNRSLSMFVMLLLISFLIACTSATPTTLPEQAESTSVDESSATNTPEATLSPTQSPTEVELPTDTPPPTATPTITLTPFPTMSASGGGVIAFARENEPDRDIYVMNADGSSDLALTSGSGWDNWPSWSPDGSKIAFTCRNDVPGTGGGICVMDADGSKIDRLTSADDWEPAWSPDGTQIAYASLRDGNPELYLMDADGKNPQRLTDNQVDDWQAAWSPDGTQIAFTSGHDGNWNIYIMDLTKGIPPAESVITQITFHNAKDSFPAWSPDGLEMLFTTNRDGNEEIYLMNVDGTYHRRLTENEAYDDHADWSPDGSQIAFISDRDGNREVFVMDMESKSIKQVTQSEIDIINDHPRWKPGVESTHELPQAGEQDYSLGDSLVRPVDEMLMVYVPGATFQMGSTEEDVESALAQCNEAQAAYCSRQFFNFEIPQHTVTVDSFWIDNTEVTNSHFQLCVDAGICEAPVACTWGAPDFTDATKANNPVVCVSWEEAQSYCEWVGGRLPTESEWEFAARGEEGYIYPWGETFDSTLANHCDVNCEELWADQEADDGYTFSAPVGIYPDNQSWVGAFDMVGNVFEWVVDWFGEYTDEELTNPTGVETGTYKVLRGGSYFYEQSRLRTTSRDSISPLEQDSSIGFRCVVAP